MNHSNHAPGIYSGFIRKTSFLIVLAVLTCTSLSAQLFQTISVALQTETLSFPFTRYFPLHPGLEIGSRMWNLDKDISNHQANVYLGGYHHQKVENGIYLRGTYQYTLKVKNTVGIEFPVGAGYQHTFYPGTYYQLDSETGDWTSKTHGGVPRALVTGGLGLTYLKSERVHPFIRHESVLDFPLAGGWLNLKTFVKLGVSIELN